MGIPIVRLTVIVALAVSISSVAAYASLSGQRIKAFSAINVAYGCLAALAQAGLSYPLDLTHFLVSLIAVGPLVLLPRAPYHFYEEG
jgi:hypothetical protein